MYRTILTWVFGGLFLFPFSVFGQGTEAEVISRLDTYLRSALETFRFNGAALISKKGKILFHKNYGFRNIENREPILDGTHFPILSTSKSITAAVVLKLNEAGKLDLDDRLEEYLPGYPNGDKIRISHLLNHTSGLHNFTDDIGLEDTTIINHPVPRERILDQIKNKPVDFKPGKQYDYNNSGYYLLGLIIEQVTGMSFQQAVRTMIFKPLQMKSSGFDYLALPEDQRVQGYRSWGPDGQIPFPYYDSTYAYAAGSIYTTAEDLNKWAEALSEKKILSADSWKLALTPGLNHYGYGWKLGNFRGLEFVRHDGGYPGYTSEFIHFPASGYSVILLSNVGDYGQSLWPLTMAISSILHELPYDNWKKRNAVAYHADEFASYIGTYAFGKHGRIEVAKEDDRLILIVPGMEVLNLLAESNTTFYLAHYNTDLHFRKGADGQVETLTIHEHGEDTHWRKVK